MIKFAVKSLIFIIPFLILISIEVLIDPFNYFSEEKNKELLEMKEDISQKNNMYLYKLINYDRNPCPTVLLGDSRMNLLFPSLFEYYNKENVASLAVGGGSLQDAIDIFRYESGKHNLKKIYWGVSIETYSGTLLRNGVKPSIEIKNSWLLYLLNRYTFSSTILICRSLIFNEKIDLYKPPFTKDEFWQSQLELSARYLKNYTYPKNYYNDLKQISNYCFERNIKLVFILSPTHIDLQKKIHEFKLDEAFNKFKLDIESFGDVYDFNYPNVITKNKNNFNDPFHHNDSISKIIVNEISTSKLKFAKYTPCIRKNTQERK